MGRRSKRTQTRVPPHVSVARHLEEAVRLFGMGNLPGAEVAFRRVLGIAPSLPEANSNLGTVLLALCRPGEAVGFFRTALKGKSIPQSWKGLGDALGELRQNQESTDCYRRALTLDPNYAGAHSGLAARLVEAEELPLAVSHLRKAIALQPSNLDERCNLAAVLMRLDRLEEARETLSRVLEEDPGHRAALFNLGLCHRDLGELEQAKEALRLSTQGARPFPEAEVALAHTCLLAGEFTEGWAGYEARRNHPSFDIARRSFPGTEWDGSPLDGRTILVYSEQGFGDLFQFSRFVSMLSGSAGRVLLEAPPQAARLLQSLNGVDEVVSRGDRPPHDIHVPLLSLPHLLGISEEELARTAVPYLGVREDAMGEEMKAVLEGLDPGPRIGIVWAGEPTHPNDRNRSASFGDLAPLAEVDGLQVVSLQFGKAAEQAAAHPLGSGVLDLAPFLGDFHDTAAALSRLDLVVTVDTAVAHLAGALGVPVNILLPHAPEWRWMVEREDTPWYPTARLFRQGTPGDWRDPIQRIRGFLEDALKSPSFPERPSVLRP